MTTKLNDNKIKYQQKNINRIKYQTKSILTELNINIY